MENKEAEKIDDLEDIQSTLKEMEEYLYQSKNRQRRWRWWSHGVTIAILIVFAIYIIAFYKLLSGNLSAEKFTNSIQTHMAELAPVMTNSSMEVMTQVVPVYMDLANEKAQTLIPKLKDLLEQHTDIFIVNMSKFTKNELRKRLDRILDKQADEFERAYPDLTDEEIERFIHETEEDIQTVLVQLSEHIVNQSIPEIMEMKGVAESLSEKHRQKDNLDLFRLFLHKLLLLLDQEIMEGEES